VRTLYNILFTDFFRAVVAVLFLADAAARQLASGFSASGLRFMTPASNRR
jgi:hypothetical protein